MSYLGYIMGHEDPSDGYHNTSDGYHNTSELPNQKLEVRIQLMRRLDNSVLASLRSDLEQNDGMEVHVDGNFNNAIVVSGLPRERGYDQNNVLRKVNSHDAGAYIIPPSETGK